MTDRIKEWAYSKPRKPANLAFTAGEERQIAYMIEDAEDRGRRDGLEAPVAVPNLYELVVQLRTQLAQCIGVLDGQDKTRPEVMVEESRAVMRFSYEALKNAAPQQDAKDAGITETSTRWFDPKVRVPADGENVLGFWGSKMLICDDVDVVHYYQGRWHEPDDRDDDYRTPDFWMPLPAAPDAAIEAEGRKG